jgi:TRAP-type C4-dicarboxylate transport system substrate-binding protein
LDFQVRTRQCPRVAAWRPGKNRRQGRFEMRPHTAIAAAIAIALHVTAASAETIKLGTLAPEGTPWYRHLRAMTDAWEAASGGRIKVRIYAGGLAGDDSAMVQKLRIGQLQAAALTGEGLTAIVADIAALQLPMLYRSDEELAYVRDRIAPKFEAMLEERSFKLLAWGDAGWVHFFAQRPVIRPTDLKPQKLFIWSQDSAYLEAWKDAGYQPVPMAVTDIHAGLQSGLINAFTAAPVAALSFQWFALAPHMTDLKWAPLVGGLVVRAQDWQRIPAELRPVFTAEARSMAASIRAELTGFGAEAVAVMRKHGLQVHAVPEEIEREWERDVRAGYPRIIGTLVSPWAAAEAERLRDEYRALRK